MFQVTSAVGTVPCWFLFLKIPWVLLTESCFLLPRTVGSLHFEMRLFVWWLLWLASPETGHIFRHLSSNNSVLQPPTTCPFSKKQAGKLSCCGPPNANHSKRHIRGYATLRRSARRGQGLRERRCWRLSSSSSRLTCFAWCRSGLSGPVARHAHNGPLNTNCNMHCRSVILLDGNESYDSWDWSAGACFSAASCMRV
jgi:hypothetical protein